jgi:hypothetical protein
MPSAISPPRDDAAFVPGFVRRRLPGWIPREAVFALLLTNAGLFIGVARLLRLEAGRASVHPDVRLVWRPLARAVAGGTALYTPGATDNKPPLFELLNLLAYLTDHYLVVLTLAVGLANGVAATCLWRACAVRGRVRIGGLGALLFLWTLPLVNGAAINVRSFTVALLLFGLVSRHPLVRGFAVGCALCVSQHAAFVVPVVAYDGYRCAGRSLAWVGRFLGALAGAVLAAFGTVLAVWGGASLAGAVHATVGSAGPYLLAYGPSVWISTATWTLITLRMHLRLWVVLAFAVWGGWLTWRRATRASGWGPAHLLLSLLVALSLPLVVRPFVTYWLYPLPVASVLAAAGVRAALLGPGVDEPTGGAGPATRGAEGARRENRTR